MDIMDERINFLIPKRSLVKNLKHGFYLIMDVLTGTERPWYLPV